MAKLEASCTSRIAILILLALLLGTSFTYKDVQGLYSEQDKELAPGFWTIISPPLMTISLLPKTTSLP